MKLTKYLLCISALMLTIFLFACNPNGSEDSGSKETSSSASVEDVTTEKETGTQASETATDKEEVTEKEEQTREYRSDSISIQKKADASKSIKLNDESISMILTLLNEKGTWVSSTAHASYNYVFVLSDGVKLEYCSAHGIFRDIEIGKELRLSDEDVAMIKKNIPIDPLNISYEDVKQKISAGQTYDEIRKIIGSSGTDLTKWDVVYRWVFNDGIVLTVEFDDSELDISEIPDKMTATNIKAENIYE